MRHLCVSKSKRPIRTGPALNMHVAIPVPRLLRSSGGKRIISKFVVGFSWCYRRFLCIMSDVSIVVLDGYTLNPGDISWSPIEALGNLTVFDRSGGLVAERARGARVVLTNKDPITAALIDQLPDMHYIGVLATGTNIVDLFAARERNIVVTNVPGYGAQSVAQHAFALLLELVNHTGKHIRSVKEGRWESCPDFCFSIDTITELAGKTLGIVGVGAIGSRVARIGHGSSTKGVPAPRYSPASWDWTR